MEVSGQLHAPGHFTPPGKSPGTHWIGGLVGPRSGCGGKEKNSQPLLGFKTQSFDHPTRSQLL